MSAGAELTVVDNPAELRYELRRGADVVGQIRYAVERGLVLLIHTEVAEAVDYKNDATGKIIEGRKTPRPKRWFCALVT